MSKHELTMHKQCIYKFRYKYINDVQNLFVVHNTLCFNFCQRVYICVKCYPDNFL